MGNSQGLQNILGMSRNAPGNMPGNTLGMGQLPQTPFGTGGSSGLPSGIAQGQMPPRFLGPPTPSPIGGGATQGMGMGNMGMRNTVPQGNGFPQGMLQNSQGMFPMNAAPTSGLAGAFGGQGINPQILMRILGMSNIR